MLSQSNQGDGTVDGTVDAIAGRIMPQRFGKTRSINDVPHVVGVGSKPDLPRPSGKHHLLAADEVGHRETGRQTGDRTPDAMITSLVGYGERGTVPVTSTGGTLSRVGRRINLPTTIDLE